MMYYHRTLLAEFWVKVIINMIEENYVTSSNIDKICIIGCAVRKEDRVESVVGDVPHQKLIYYQTEPLVENHWIPRENIIEYITKHDFYEVWDYDKQNVEYLRSLGLTNVKFKPFLYTSRYELPESGLNKDIDLLFFGMFSEQRLRFFFDLFNKANYPEEWNDAWSKVNFVWLYNSCDAKLDELIMRSKIHLDLRNSGEEDARQRQTRIATLLANKCCVLSQKSTINYYGDMIIEFNDAQDCLNKLVPLLMTGDWKPYGEYAYNKFKNSKLEFRSLWGVDE